MGGPVVQMRYIARFACTLALTACARAPEGAVDLGDRPWRVRTGFAQNELATPAEGRASRPPLALGKLAPQPEGPVLEYTVSVTFDTAELGPARLYGLLVRHVSPASEVYLNGTLVAGEVRLDESGALAARKVHRRWLVALPGEAVKRGVNRLDFRVAGDPPLVAAVPNFAAAFRYADGYYVGDYDTLANLSDAWTEILWVSFAVVFGLFAVSLAAFSGGRLLVALGVFAILSAVYIAARSSFVLDWFADSTPLRRLEFASQFLSSAAFLVFVSALLGRGHSFARAFCAFWVALAVLVAVVPYRVALFSATLWQASALASMAGVAFMLLQTIRAGNRELARYVPPLLLLTVCVAWDTAMMMFFVSDVRLLPIGFLVFVGTLGINLGSRFLRVHRAAEAAEAALGRTQERMKAFYNATLEAVCLREGNFIVDVNPAFSRLLGYAPDEITGRPFTQLIAAESQAAVSAALEVGVERHEAVAVRRDGATFTAELEHRALPAGEQRIIVTAIRDVTQRKEADLKLRERNLELESLNQRMVERELRMIELKREIRALGGNGEGKTG